MLDNDTLQMICDERLEVGSLLKVECLNSERNRTTETFIGQVRNTRIEDGDIVMGINVITPDYFGATVRLSRCNVTPIGEHGREMPEQMWNMETYGQVSLTPDVVKDVDNLDWDSAASMLLGQV